MTSELDARRTAALIQQVDDLTAEVKRLRRLVEPAPLGVSVPSIARLVSVTAAEFDVTAPAILGPRRGPEFALARHVVMFLASTRTKHSLAVIGRCLNRDHTTVLHGIRRIAELVKADPAFAARLERVAAAAQDQQRETAA